MVRKLKATFLGGLVGGAADIVYAFVVFGPLTYGLSPERVLKSVAAGWIGREAARAGGWDIALLGLATHFAIATIMAAIFVSLSGGLTPLRKRPVLWGVLYGLFLYVAMNYVVVPLSAAATGQFAHDFSEAARRLRVAFSEVRGGGEGYPWLIWGAIFTHTMLVGVPIAWINARLNPLGRS